MMENFGAKFTELTKTALPAKKLKRLAQDYQDVPTLVLYRALKQLLARPNGWGGLNSPTSIIFEELPSYVAAAKREAAEQEKSRQLAERMKTDDERRRQEIDAQLKAKEEDERVLTAEELFGAS